MAFSGYHRNPSVSGSPRPACVNGTKSWSQEPRRIYMVPRSYGLQLKKILWIYTIFWMWHDLMDDTSPWRTLLQAFSLWQLGADFRVEININTVCTWYSFLPIDINLQQNSIDLLSRHDLYTWYNLQFFVNMAYSTTGLFIVTTGGWFSCRD